MGVDLVMLPVSAGDATLLMTSDVNRCYTVLIDTGLRNNEALAYLQSIGVFHLDLVILSHPDMDHLGGLREILSSNLMSVDTIWCFDLSFLRKFVQTGIIPQPEPATRSVIYFECLKSVLDEFSNILRTANGKNVRVLQVAEGYKLCLGPMLLEVLYPHQSFYNSLHDPKKIKALLKNRKIPKDWSDDSHAYTPDQDYRRAIQASAISFPSEEVATLSGGYNRDNTNETTLLINEAPQSDDDIDNTETDKLPLKIVGTLYNNLSIVVKISVLGGISGPTALFPGDLTDWSSLIARHAHELHVDILKIPHHGSSRVVCDLLGLYKCYYHCGHLCRLYAKLCSLEEFGFLCRKDVKRYIDLFDKYKDIELIGKIVSPIWSLIFPYPSRKLPDLSFSNCTSKIVTNRKNHSLTSLKSKNNTAASSIITLGMERNDIQRRP